MVLYILGNRMFITHEHPHLFSKFAEQIANHLFPFFQRTFILKKHQPLGTWTHKKREKSSYNALAQMQKKLRAADEMFLTQHFQTKKQEPIDCENGKTILDRVYRYARTNERFRVPSIRYLCIIPTDFQKQLTLTAVLSLCTLGHGGNWKSATIHIWLHFLLFHKNELKKRMQKTKRKN